MAVKVIKWPPVGAIGAEWTEIAPVQVSRSMTTGAERVSAFQRKRRMATISVPAIGKNMFDAGYMEMLKRFLEGIHLVRLHSYPINWHLDTTEKGIRRGNVYSDLGVTFIEVFGLQPDTLVARPADFIRLLISADPNTELSELPWANSEDPLVWENSGQPVTWYHGSGNLGISVQVTQPVFSDDTGRAVIPVFETVPDQNEIYLIFGASDTGAFRPISYPRSVQPASGNWSYDWEFREVFADEVGGFVEVDPWQL